jgi:hypothetical protein
MDEICAGLYPMVDCIISNIQPSGSTIKRLVYCVISYNQKAAQTLVNRWKGVLQFGVHTVSKHVYSDFT